MPFFHSFLRFSTLILLQNMKIHSLSLVLFRERGLCPQAKRVHQLKFTLSVMLYSSTDPIIHDQVIDANSYPPFKLVDSTIITRIMEELDDHIISTPTSLVGALTKALCCDIFTLRSPIHETRLTLCYFLDVNRVASSPTPSTTDKPAENINGASFPDPRILVLSVSPDLSTSYIPIMNAIFSAQKLVKQ